MGAVQWIVDVATEAEVSVRVVVAGRLAFVETGRSSVTADEPGELMHEAKLTELEHERVAERVAAIAAVHIAGFVA